MMCASSGITCSYSVVCVTAIVWFSNHFLHACDIPSLQVVAVSPPVWFHPGSMCGIKFRGYTGEGSDHCTSWWTVKERNTPRQCGSQLYLSCRERFLPFSDYQHYKVSFVGQCTHITWHHTCFTQFSIQLHSGTEIYCMLQVQYGLVIPPVGGVSSFNLLTAGRDRCLQILVRRGRHLHIPAHSSKYLLGYLRIQIPVLTCR